ncbi:MAG: carbohydrate ABC transporter permease [Anaerolineae bacterium]
MTPTTPTTLLAATRRRLGGWPQRPATREAVAGYLIISPWLLGLLAFTAFPLIASIYLSFTKYNLLQPPSWTGLANYRTMLEDERFIASFRITTVYVLVTVPSHLIAAFLVAEMMNQKIPWLSFFRTVYYLPAIVPAMATFLLWTWVFNPEFGILNWGLGLLGIRGPAWLADPRWALWAIIVMSFWGIGGSMVIYLSGLQGIPTEYYEAARIDGAGALACFQHITVPQMTPVIFYNLIMGIIGAFQTFGASYVMTRGGPGYSTLFYTLYLYYNAFNYGKMGYACAMAWILFVVIMFFTILLFRTSSTWVYYSGEVR